MRNTTYWIARIGQRQQHRLMAGQRQKPDHPIQMMLPQPPVAANRFTIRICAFAAFRLAEFYSLAIPEPSTLLLLGAGGGLV